MQRLFSMFPGGRAGIGLLLLRLSLCSFLLADALDRFREAPPQLACFLLVAAGASIAIGLMTPYFSIVACLIELARLSDPTLNAPTAVLLASATTISIALLGPGAYSLDGRLFGRRLMSLPPGGDQHQP